MMFEKTKMRYKFRMCTLMVMIIALTISPAVVSLLSADDSGISTPIKILILPFKVSGTDKYQFLSTSVKEMLSARIFTPDLIEIVAPFDQKEAPSESRPGTSADPETTARRYGADVVISGQITFLGEHYSIDASALDIRDGRILATSSASGEKPEEIISWASSFASKLKNTIRKTAGKKAPATTLISPKDLLRASGLESAKVTPPGSKVAPNPYLLPESKEAPFSRKGFWKSREIPLKIRRIAIADLLGNGNKEIAVAGKKKVLIFRLINGKLEEIASFKCGAFQEYIDIGAADADGDGRAEIYLTSASRDRVSSYVLSWQNGKFAKITGNFKYYLRIIRGDGGKTLIVGQKRGISQPFYGPIKLMKWIGGKLVPAGDLKTPGMLDIYSFNIGDVTGDGKKEFVVLDGSDRLRVYDESGKLIWRSREYFGGSAMETEEDFTDWSETNPEEAEEAMEPRLACAPVRILIRDLDGNGLNEILVTKNFSSFGRYLKRLRIYTEGEVDDLVWNGIGFDINWKTRKYEGYVADIALADIDSDGIDQLIIALVLRLELKDLISPKSVILAYDLQGTGKEGGR